MIRPVLRFLAAAAAEVEGAAEWYGERSSEAREGFLAELDHAVTMIQEAPGRWPSYLHGTKRILLRRYPFSVVYRLVGTDLQIIAVAHQKRRPGYWSDRA